MCKEAEAKSTFMLEHTKKEKNTSGSHIQLGLDLSHDVARFC